MEPLYVFNVVLLCLFVWIFIAYTDEKSKTITKKQTLVYELFANSGINSPIIVRDIPIVDIPEPKNKSHKNNQSNDKSMQDVIFKSSFERDGSKDNHKMKPYESIDETENESAGVSKKEDFSINEVRSGLTESDTIVYIKDNNENNDHLSIPTEIDEDSVDSDITTAQYKDDIKPYETLDEHDKDGTSNTMKVSVDNDSNSQSNSLSSSSSKDNITSTTTIRTPSSTSASAVPSAQQKDYNDIFVLKSIIHDLRIDYNVATPPKTSVTPTSTTDGNTDDTDTITTTTIIIEESPHEDLANALIELSFLYINIHDYNASIEVYTEGIIICKHIYGEYHSKIASYYNQYGNHLYAHKYYNESLIQFEQAYIINEMLYGEEHKYIATTLNNVGNVYTRLKKYNMAIDAYETALKIYKATLASAQQGVHPDSSSSSTTPPSPHENIHVDHNSVSSHKINIHSHHHYHHELLNDIAITLSNIGIAYYSIHEYKIAMEKENEAYHIRVTLYGGSGSGGQGGGGGGESTSTGSSSSSNIHHAIQSSKQIMAMIQKKLQQTTTSSSSSSSSL